MPVSSYIYIYCIFVLLLASLGKFYLLPSSFFFLPLTHRGKRNKVPKNISLTHFPPSRNVLTFGYGYNRKCTLAQTRQERLRISSEKK